MLRPGGHPASAPLAGVATPSGPGRRVAGRTLEGSARRVAGRTLEGSVRPATDAASPAPGPLGERAPGRVAADPRDAPCGPVGDRVSGGSRSREPFPTPGMARPYAA